MKAFFREHVASAVGEQVEMKAMAGDYRAWCSEKGLAPLKLGAFLDEIEKLCRRLGIEIAVSNDQRVYCLDVNQDQHRGVRAFWLALNASNVDGIDRGVTAVPGGNADAICSARDFLMLTRSGI